MASNKTVNKTEGKVVEKNDLEKVQEVAAAVRHKTEPVVAPGEHYKKVKVHFKTLICGDFGCFNSGEYGEIPLITARELENDGLVEICKD